MNYLAEDNYCSFMSSAVFSKALKITSDLSSSIEWFSSFEKNAS
jgi:hypothetical protein